MDQQKTGLLIASLRKEKKLTQKELADKLGITDRAVSKWERGLGCPDISLLDDLSKILDISILEILKGRRLDKDEIINNENLIESMNYSKSIFKNKIKYYFNLLVVIFILITSLLLLFFNLKSIYYLNKKYYNNLEELETDLLNEVENNIEMINSNQGSYSDEDYNKILNHTDQIKGYLNSKRDLNYLSKKDYTYNEIIEFYHYYKEYIDYEIFSRTGELIYEMVHKYEPSVVNNMIKYSSYGDSLIQFKHEMFNELTYPYYNNKTINNDIVATIVTAIYLKYKRNNILLEDVIKVGEINE